MGDLVAFPRPDRTATPEPLWREAVGRELREERRTAGRTLADVAGDAAVSTQYLSEIERGRKEPSSEVLGAVAGALDLRLVDLTARVSRRLGAGTISGPVCRAA
ncbi:MAG: helix-turn-helix transcriptional regulator [Nocardioides sp.]